MSPPLQNLERKIAQLEEAAAAAKARTSELRSATKDAAEVEKRLRRMIDREIPERIAGIVDEAINAEVRKGLTEYAETLEKAQAAAVDKVGLMFEELGRIYMEGGSDGQQSIPELVEERLLAIRRIRTSGASN